MSNNQGTCVVCYRQVKKLINNRYCSKDCEQMKEVKCDICGKKNDSNDSIFCKKCKNMIISYNEEVLKNRIVSNDVFD
jgi:hypothetical protein